MRSDLLSSSIDKILVESQKFSRGFSTASQNEHTRVRFQINKILGFPHRKCDDQNITSYCRSKAVFKWKFVGKG